MKSLINHYLLLLFFCISATYSMLEDLINIFQGDLCIEGSLNNIYLKKTGKSQENEKLKNILSLTSTDTLKETQKSSLSRLNELVDYHQINYYFKLEDEEGPAHNKEFTISLSLGKEKYVGEGTSLKNAKRNVAAKALEKTQYEFPKHKKKSHQDIEKLPPTVLLNNIGSRLGIEVTYYLVDKNEEEILHSNIVLAKTNKSYLKKLNDSIYSDKKLKMKRNIDKTNGPFHLKLKFGDHVFYTTSHSIQSGRHDVALKALDYLDKNRDQLNMDCLNKGFEAQCKENKEQLKSPISKVYEESQKRNLDVEFEIIDEFGLPHKKTFVTECRFGDIKTTGESHSKKESKRLAATNMLEKIRDFEPLATEVKIRSFNNNKKKRKMKKKVIKNKFDEITMVLDNVGKSITNLVKNIFSEENQNIDSTEKFKENNDKQSTAPKQKKASKFDSDHTKKSSEDELLELSNVLNFKVAFTDFNENRKHISLLSIYINPEYICIGEDETEFQARNVASKNALHLLDKIGIYATFLEEKDNLLERETKEEIRIILDHTISTEKEEL